jgi:hypothetical protein
MLTYFRISSLDNEKLILKGFGLFFSCSRFELPTLEYDFHCEENVEMIETPMVTLTISFLKSTKSTCNFVDFLSYW